MLRSVPLFAALADGQLIALEECVAWQNYPRSTLILRQGEQTDGLYILVTGRAKVLMTNEQGQDVILAHLGLHDFFGEMGLIDNQPGTHSVVTLEPCELLFISRANFARWLANDFGILMRIAGILARRLGAAYRRIESLALMDVHGRVACVLLDSAEQIDGKRIIRKPPRKVAIAQMIGASREMVSRVMKEFEHNGHIRVDKRSIELFDNLRGQVRMGRERIRPRLNGVQPDAPQLSMIACGQPG